jgi:hypothetical protein
MSVLARSKDMLYIGVTFAWHLGGQSCDLGKPSNHFATRASLWYENKIGSFIIGIIRACVLKFGLLLKGTVDLKQYSGFVIGNRCQSSEP